MLKIKKQISSNEKLMELQESTAKLIERERIPGQDEFEKHDQQKGTMLHSNDMIRRILRMNHKLWVEDSVNMPGHANFYYPAQVSGAKTCAAAPFKKGPMREFSIIYQDRAGRPVAVEYGWRQVLLRLMQKNLITWQQVQMGFPIYEMRQSSAFDKQVQRFKN